jgi:hypothetical protein
VKNSVICNNGATDVKYGGGGIEEQRGGIKLCGRVELELDGSHE